jgi:hypothetical protein
LPLVPDGKGKRKRSKRKRRGDLNKKLKIEGPGSNPAASDHDTEENEGLGEAQFFEACLLEYGDIQGKRRFKISGTTIMN